MRMIVLQPGQDLSALLRRIAVPGGGEGAAIEKLKALNPHIDFARPPADAVLLLPDPPAAAGSDGVIGESVAAAVLDQLADDVQAGLAQSSGRVRAGFSRADAKSREIEAAMNSAAVRRAIDGDAELRVQAAAVAARLAADQARARQTDESLASLAQTITDELAALGRLLR